MSNSLQNHLSNTVIKKLNSKLLFCCFRNPKQFQQDRKSKKIAIYPIGCFDGIKLSSATIHLSSKTITIAIINKKRLTPFDPLLLVLMPSESHGITNRRQKKSIFRRIKFYEIWGKRSFHRKT